MHSLLPFLLFTTAAAGAVAAVGAVVALAVLAAASLEAYRRRKRQRCLDCKRLRGHDDDCALDMSGLPPPSFAVTSASDQRSDYYEDMP
jgi:hypothetical protein